MTTPIKVAFALWRVLRYGMDNTQVNIELQTVSSVDHYGVLGDNKTLDPHLAIYCDDQETSTQFSDCDRNFKFEDGKELAIYYL